MMAVRIPSMEPGPWQKAIEFKLESCQSNSLSRCLINGKSESDASSSLVLHDREPFSSKSPTQALRDDVSIVSIRWRSGGRAITLNQRSCGVSLKRKMPGASQNRCFEGFRDGGDRLNDIAKRGPVLALHRAGLISLFIQTRHGASTGLTVSEVGTYCPGDPSGWRTPEGKNSRFILFAEVRTLKIDRRPWPILKSGVLASSLPNTLTRLKYVFYCPRFSKNSH